MIARLCILICVMMGTAWSQECPPPTYLCSVNPYPQPVYVPPPAPPVCYYQWYRDASGNLISLYTCQ